MSKPVRYTREQIGHSVIVTTLLFLLVIPIPVIMYWGMSPRHYFHL